jgi:pyruvate/2-oxoglutarate dehydrogenase complex dihydrolipoamide dehydrogenase (E3) component
MPEFTYDIIVIGAGSAGLSVSLFIAEVGLKTLVIDKTDFNIGGDCLNYGCVPSKALLHIAKAMKNVKAFKKNNETFINIKETMQYVHGKQSKIRTHENADFLRLKGIDVELGIAKFFDKHSVVVNDKKFSAKKIVIAAGSRPKKLNVEGIELVKWYNNESIFDLHDLPKKMMIIGGGPVATEIAFALQNLGSDVTIVHRGDLILPKEQRSISEILMQQLKNNCIHFISTAEVKSFSNNNTAIIELQNGNKIEHAADAFFIAIGRESDIKTLELDKAGIETKNNKIVSNKYLQTTNKDVFVCGDIAGDLQLSHAAEQHARLLLNNFFSLFKKQLNNDYMSWVIFTEPEVATFGLSQKQLECKNKSFEKLELNFDEDDRATTDNYNYGKLILYIAKKISGKQKILGGTMIAPNAGEMIQELILAMQAKLSINQIFNKVYPYPVASRVNQQIIAQYKKEH